MYAKCTGVPEEEKNVGRIIVFLQYEKNMFKINANEGILC